MLAKSPVGPVYAVCLLVAALLLAPGARAASYAGGKPLPTPAGLATDVHFWELVFGKYRPDDCLFHDKDNLGVVYFVKHLPAGSPRAQASVAKRYLELLRHAILELSNGAEARTPLQKRIVQVTRPELRYPAYYRYAAVNIRCQRGVDLSPSLARSKHHVHMVKKILGTQALPTDLAYLPHLESGYDVQARSRVGARGLWQLMPATARMLGLRLRFGLDPRTDPLRSTRAAASMLKDFYAQTGSWPLAITAYNYGINGTLRAIKLYGNDYMDVRTKHHTSVFGFAARNYYPSFLAVRNVAAAAEAAAARGRGLAEQDANGLF